MKNWIKKNKSDLILYFGFILVLIILITLAVLPQIGKIGTNSPYNSTAIPIGPGVQWYAIFIVFGLIMGAYFAFAEIKRFGWKSDDLLDGILIIAPLSILGARLYYIINSGVPITEFFQFRDGGLAIHGAIIVATISVFFFAKFKKLDFFLIVDILAIGFLIGQITGRWGNFMNAEAHSAQIVENKFLIAIIPGFIKHQMQFSGSSMLSNGFYHPTFLYESFWNFIGLTGLLIIRRKKSLRAGDMVGIYLIWYGLGRSFLEAGYRGDQLDAVFGIPVNVLMSLVFVGAGVLYLILKRVFIKNQLYYVDALVNEIDYPWEKVTNNEKLESNNL